MGWPADRKFRQKILFDSVKKTLESLKYLETSGTKILPSSYTAQKNGIVQKMNRTRKIGIQTLLVCADTPVSLRAESL